MGEEDPSTVTTTCGTGTTGSGSHHERRVRYRVGYREMTCTVSDPTRSRPTPGITYGSQVTTSLHTRTTTDGRDTIGTHHGEPRTLLLTGGDEKGVDRVPIRRQPTGSCPQTVRLGRP